MKINFVLCFLVMMVSCASHTIINDKKYVVEAEDFQLNPNKDTKYIVKAWRYEPSIKLYRIKTDSLYRIGSKLVIKNGAIYNK